MKSAYLSALFSLNHQFSHVIQSLVVFTFHSINVAFIISQLCSAMFTDLFINSKTVPVLRGVAIISEVRRTEMYYIQSRSSLYTEYTNCVGPRKHSNTLALKDDFIFRFRIWPAAMKTWMIIYCNAVLLPFLHKNQSNHVTWMWWSLLLETKTLSWKHSEPQKSCFSIDCCDQSWIFSIITPALSHDPSEIILMCWFVQTKFHINFLMISSQHCCPFMSPLLSSIEGNSYAGCRFSLWISAWAENLPPIWFAQA